MVTDLVDFVPKTWQSPPDPPSPVSYTVSHAPNTDAPLHNRRSTTHKSTSQPLVTETYVLEQLDRLQPTCMEQPVGQEKIFQIIWV
ncbi:hypothetical protein SARC_03292 [Sphaeroforma arctica JP610]|uniref:Uncharacterized protein n=1 Tax=Sphaeroforma arctica JP610 TaxID=667725 RepID=A0A0L0G644_9EUKA|nr:hypothetical protein SARC_03292 [Sphaeroforma arctica JP610]KNC84487.1 hypothetical protein SARC_03292 [Sphaeroforma arctica JP610]|eukprot:XP_014158389.1 hypothetical protein SARC_03292 [Sphaeroforma arctica JP610]